MTFPPLDIRDIAIIDALPLYNFDKIILNIGCGKGRIDFHLMELGFKVYATDYKKHDTWINLEKKNRFVKFSEVDIFKFNSFPIKNASVVICSEVLEHLVNYRKALKNILKLTKLRVIITIPFEYSFGGAFAPPPEGHCNFWSDNKNEKFKDIKEFYKLCSPYSVSISKIRTKQQDVAKKQYCYLIIIDKRQDLIFFKKNSFNND